MLCSRRLNAQAVASYAENANHLPKRNRTAWPTGHMHYQDCHRGCVRPSAPAHQLARAGGSTSGVHVSESVGYVCAWAAHMTASQHPRRCSCPSPFSQKTSTSHSPRLPPTTSSSAQAWTETPITKTNLNIHVHICSGMPINIDISMHIYIYI